VPHYYNAVFLNGHTVEFLLLALLPVALTLGFEKKAEIMCLHPA
jgi:hypothetical protein